MALKKGEILRGILCSYCHFIVFISILLNLAVFGTNKTTVHDSAVEMFGKTAIVWNRIMLEAVVRESEVKTEFTVTEIYQKKRQSLETIDFDI